MKHTLHLLVAAVLALLSACHGTSDTPTNDTLINGTISITTSRTLLQADGVDEAVIAVYATDSNGKVWDVTKDADIYITGEETPYPTSTFTTTTDGEYEFYALYGLEVSGSVKIRAVSGIANLPEDDNKSNTSFGHRIMLLQHTGTECAFCPGMMTTLKALAQDEAYASLYHHVASHSYNPSDPAYSLAAKQLSLTVETPHYPWLTFNLATTNAEELEDIKEQIDLLHKERADVGICASATLIGGEIFVNTALKAATEGDYRVAVWILEDGIVQPQSGATEQWQNTHNNCLRDMSGEIATERIYGSRVGFVEAGKSVKHIASVAVGNTWNTDNCKALIIATCNEELVNCTVCPLNGSVGYSYAE